jgi:hypothetical protein
VRKISGAFALLFCLDFKFVTIFRKKRRELIPLVTKVTALTVPLMVTLVPAVGTMYVEVRVHHLLHLPAFNN